MRWRGYGNNTTLGPLDHDPQSSASHSPNSILFGIWLWARVSAIKVGGAATIRSDNGRTYLLEEEQRGEDEIINKAAELQAAITEGATSFLATEYRYVGLFMAGFSVLIFVMLASEDGFAKAGLYNGLFSTIAFIIGATTSIVSGYVGMMIATYANARTALEARKGVAPAFMAAFRSGAVMGFLLTSLALLVLFVLIFVYRIIYGDDNWKGLFEAITGYGLGGSSIALFGRVGGGIYTKAADVGADLVGKVEKDIPEDDPRNPAVIADNVGDNVGDIAGMGADLFGSFAESTCAALVVSSVSSLGAGATDLTHSHIWVSMMFPLLVSSVGIFCCLITTLIATDIKPARIVSEIEHTLKMQLIISTVLITPAVFVIAWVALPKEFDHIFISDPTKIVKSWYMFICVSCGLWGGLIIGLATEYYTSNRFKPVQVCVVVVVRGEYHVYAIRNTHPNTGCCRCVPHGCRHRHHLWPCPRLQIHHHPLHHHCHLHLCRLYTRPHVWHCMRCAGHVEFPVHMLGNRRIWPHFRQCWWYCRDGCHG